MQAGRNAESPGRQGIVATPKKTQPGVNRPAIRAAMQRFMAGRSSRCDLPTPEEVMAYLEDQVAARGRNAAHADYAYLQMAAAERWGAEHTAFFARVLREHRVTEKRKRHGEWDKASAAITRLPEAWQPPMQEVCEQSRSARANARGLIWSAARISAVAAALARWASHCAAQRIDLQPTGASLRAYASALLATGAAGPNSVADYLERIVAGYHDVITRTPPGLGAAFVLAQYRDSRTAPTTKTASQIVGATTICDLGSYLFDAARRCPTRGTEAAILARNGVLLMLAAALPERSRALSALAFDQTLRLGPRPLIIINLPGEVLKQRQVRKAGSRRQEELHNPILWDALSDYRRAFRPIFDGGNALFPSKQALGQALSERSLSQIVANLTEAHLGTRITLHRVRDNVATEAVEELPNGLMVAAGVLGHRDARTTATHYDRSKGRAAMETIARLTRERRGAPTRLRL